MNELAYEAAGSIPIPVVDVTQQFSANSYEPSVRQLADEVVALARNMVRLRFPLCTLLNAGLVAPLFEEAAV